MKVYIDESGDMGFRFIKPYRRGGSSRFLTIAFVLVPNDLADEPRRIVKKLYSKRKRPPKKELKGSDLTPDEKLYVANRTKKLLKARKSIKIFAITVNKVKVRPEIRNDTNILYNYMIGLVLPKKIMRFARVALIHDKRTIKVKSGNSLKDYLKVKLWYSLNSNTVLCYHPEESHRNLNLQFVDYIVNIIWSRFEDNATAPYDLIKTRIDSIPLFFSP